MNAKNWFFFSLLVFLCIFVDDVRADIRNSRLRGRIYIENENYEKAAELLETALKKNPENIGLMSDLAMVYTQLGKWQAALTLYNQILANDINNIDAINQKIYLLKNYSSFFQENQEYENNENGNKKKYYLSFKLPFNYNIISEAHYSYLKFSDKIPLIPQQAKTEAIKIGGSLEYSRGYRRRLKLNIDSINTDYNSYISPELTVIAPLGRTGNFSFSYQYKDLFDNPYKAVNLGCRKNSSMFSLYYPIMQKIFFSMSGELKKYFIFNNEYYGKGNTMTFFLTKEIFSYSAKSYTPPNFINISFSYSRSKNEYSDNYSHLFTLSKKSGQINFSADSAYQLTNKIYFETHLNTGGDNARNIDFFNSYGIFLKLTAVLSARFHTSTEYNFSSEADDSNNGKTSVFQLNIKYYY